MADPVTIWVVLGGGAALVAIITGVRTWFKRNKPQDIPEFQLLLDEFKVETRGRTEDQIKLGIALEEIDRLRKELSAFETHAIEAIEAPAKPGEKALTAGEKQEQRAKLEAKLAAVVDHFTAGYEAYEREDWKSALKHYEAALAQHRTIAVTNNLAVVYRRMSRFDEALKLYDEAESLCRSQGLPENSALAKNRGVVYMNLGRYDEALSAYDDAERLRKEQGLPEDFGLAQNRGVVYMDLGRYDEALSAYDDAQRLRKEQGLPEDSALVTNRGAVYHRLGHYDDALAAYGDAERLRKKQGLPDDPILAMNRGVIFRNLGRYDDALAAYDEAESLRREQGLPDNPLITFNRALVYMGMGDRGKACELARKARDMYQGMQMPVHQNILNFIKEKCGGEWK